MSRKDKDNDKKKYDNDKNDQEQEQDQKQAELQAQLQGQLQGQGQGQAQGQAQFAYQDLKSENENENENENKNVNENKLENEVDNKVESKVDNDVDNKVENKVSNEVENKVDVEVDVKVDLDVEGGGHDWLSDNDLLDLDIKLDDLDGAFVALAEDIYQNVSGAGNDNAFNIDQVNTMVDNDYLHEAKVWNDGHEFEQEAKADGGWVDIDDIKVDTGHFSSIADSVTSTADGIASNEAFTQNIVMGANIQFNTIDMTIAGNDVSSDITDDIGVV